uniref:3-oxo-5alpha-steroid 4-dehydrogenase (NADP(+)) n=1 Tax=Panagrellus redivivus TaxID=6233 RepID=A0A7E4UTA9_PANRE
MFDTLSNWISLAPDESILLWLSSGMIVSAVVTFAGLKLFDFHASYGRYYDQSMFAKFAINGRLAWFLQESPALLIPTIAIYYHGENMNISKSIAMIMFVGHYVQRTLVYPFLIKGGKPTTPIILICAWFICVWNGFLQGYYYVIYADFDENHAYSPISLFGILVFVIGMTTNIHSDSILRNLRGPGEVDYKIPHGGLFDWVSCGNYFGEIMEWLGYAIFCRSLPALGFALFTMANIAPRASQYHQDYQKKFPEYPKERRILAPFLY